MSGRLCHSDALAGFYPGPLGRYDPDGPFDCLRLCYRHGFCRAAPEFDWNNDWLDPGRRWHWRDGLPVVDRSTVRAHQPAYHHANPAGKQPGRIRPSARLDSPPSKKAIWKLSISPEHRLNVLIRRNEKLNNTPFSIDHPGRIFCLECLRLPGLQADHDLPLKRAHGNERHGKISTYVLHPGRWRPVTIIQ